MLLGQIDRFSEMGSRLRSGGNTVEFGGWLLALIGIAVLIGVTVSMWYLIRRAGTGTLAHANQQLFKELCRVHGVTRRDGHQLRRLAAIHALESPAQIFVRPELFELPSIAAVPSRDWPVHMKLRDRLFARRIESAASSGPS